MTKRMTPLKSIRLKCLDCCAYQLAEVRLCPTINCPLFNFRSGHNTSKQKCEQKHKVLRKEISKNKPSTSEKQEQTK